MVQSFWNLKFNIVSRNKKKWIIIGYSKFNLKMERPI